MYVLTIVSLVLVVVGWLPAFARDRKRHHAWLAAAALLAIPGSRVTLDSPMHDLSIAFPWLEHARWCVPEPGMWVTGNTAPFLLFGPLALAALWSWYRARNR